MVGAEEVFGGVGEVFEAEVFVGFGEFLGGEVAGVFVGAYVAGAPAGVEELPFAVVYFDGVPCVVEVLWRAGLAWFERLIAEAFGAGCVSKVYVFLDNGAYLCHVLQRQLLPSLQ